MNDNGISIYSDIYTKISTDDDLMETVSHGSPEYPFKFYDEAMGMFDFNRIDWHWHTEFEFVYMQSGSINVHIDTEQFTLNAGQGLFVNSKVLHQFDSDNNAEIPNFVFMPSFIAPEESLIYTRYVEPVLNSSLSHQVFSPECEWQSRILQLMRELIAINCGEGNASADFDTLILIQQLWLIFKNNISLKEKDTDKRSAASQARLQLMMQYIHLNYAGPVTLEDIASEAGLSKSSALNLFKSYLHTTPVDYLIKYRLKEAAALLSKTEKKVGVISGETGFENTDYFCRTFKKQYGVTPTKYRRQKD